MEAHLTVSSAIIHNFSIPHRHIIISLDSTRSGKKSTKTHVASYRFICNQLIGRIPENEYGLELFTSIACGVRQKIHERSTSEGEPWKDLDDGYDTPVGFNITFQRLPGSPGSQRQRQHDEEGRDESIDEFIGFIR